MIDNFIIQNLPKSEQPYEKAFRLGIEFLSDAELLAVILRSGSKDASVLDTSRKILQITNGLKGLCDRDNRSTLSSVKGIGRVKLLELQAIGEIAKRIGLEQAGERLLCNEPDSIYRAFRESMCSLNQEEVWMLILDSKLLLKRRVTVSKGTVNSSLLSPSDVFRLALQNNAVCFVLMHNHPSGDPSPSQDDISLTETIQALGNALQLPMIDHIIFGSDNYYSFQNAI